MAINNGVLCENFRRGYAKNAGVLAVMLTKAGRSGRKVGGYSAAQLGAMVTAYEGYARLDDASMLAHLNESLARVQARREALCAS